MRVPHEEGDVDAALDAALAELLDNKPADPIAFLANLCVENVHICVRFSNRSAISVI